MNDEMKEFRKVLEVLKEVFEEGREEQDEVEETYEVKYYELLKKYYDLQERCNELINAMSEIAVITDYFLDEEGVDE
jgi:uncharacterized protein YfbU (UPF0304 family)